MSELDYDYKARAKKSLDDWIEELGGGVETDHELTQRYIESSLVPTLRDVYRAGVESVIKQMEAIARHQHDNAKKLGAYRSSLDEARCREWSAMLLDQALQILAMNESASEFHIKMDRIKEKLMEKIILSESEDE